MVTWSKVTDGPLGDGRRVETCVFNEVYDKADFAGESRRRHLHLHCHNFSYLLVADVIDPPAELFLLWRPGASSLASLQ